MSRLTDLLRQVERVDSTLAADLRAEVRALSDRRPFGLNFERHVPEAVDLPGRRVQRRDKVRVLPPRENPNAAVERGVWQVVGIEEGTATLRRTSGEEQVFARVEDLVVVAEFRDPITPGLRHTGSVRRGPDDAPAHTVINGENFHALQALTYTHAGAVDAIYIDPPYNTGAKDWKYDNDYVDADDAYRHSKWLAMMERRLLLAKQLLNTESSVLIVTIDEKEYLRLGLLLQQVFPEARLQMISAVINHRGVARGREFSRVDEQIYFVSLGESGPRAGSDDMLTVREHDDLEPVRWDRLIKGSNSARRIDRPNLFYPVFLDPTRAAVVAVGDPISLADDRTEVHAPDGLVAVWPLARDGSEKRWQMSAQTLRGHLARGTARAGSYDAKNDRWSILYLNRGQIERIKSGEIKVIGRDANGALQLEAVSRPATAAMTVWNRQRHNAGYYGSGIVGALLAGRRFPFPKSLYAVEDVLRFFVADKPDAVVLDFFAGSGTTAHAVMRLNRQDGGLRQCISVTNNEVSAEEAKRLRGNGLRPGDAEWERYGICHHITKPRIEAAITGRTPDGEPIAGGYKFTDEFAMAEGFEANAEFFTLTYESPRQVAHHRAFERLAPLLWLRAGATGRRIEVATDDYDVADTYAVLFDLDASGAFVEAVTRAAEAGDKIRLAYVVTDDERAYQSVCAEMPEQTTPVRLYASYLTTFATSGGVGR